MYKDAELKQLEEVVLWENTYWGLYVNIICVISSTGQRPVELMPYPVVRRPAVCLSVNNMLFLYLLCY